MLLTLIDKMIKEVQPATIEYGVAKITIFSYFAFLMVVWNYLDKQNIQKQKNFISLAYQHDIHIQHNIAGMQTNNNGSVNIEYFIIQYSFTLLPYLL